MSKSILIVDDHPLVLTGMAQALDSEGFVIHGTATGGEEAVCLCKEKGLPDLVISDIRMKPLDGFATLTKLRRNFPGLKVLLLAGMPLREEVENARAGGAIGYVPKSLPWKALVCSINRALVGEDFVDSPLPARRNDILSPREEGVVRYLNEGKTQDEIAALMKISRETVKTYVKSLKEKLNATSSAGAVGRAYELGILRA